MEGNETCAAAERVYDAVEAMVATSGLGLRCEYEYLPTDRAETPCVTMQVLPGDPVEKVYLDGSFVASLALSLVLRQSADDTSARLDAQRVLRGLADALRSLADDDAPYELDLGPGTALREISMATNPARIQAHPGMSDYQVTMIVKYRQQR